MKFVETLKTLWLTNAKFRVAVFFLTLCHWILFTIALGLSFPYCKTCGGLQSLIWICWVLITCGLFLPQTHSLYRFFYPKLTSESIPSDNVPLSLLATDQDTDQDTDQMKDPVTDQVTEENDVQIIPSISENQVNLDDDDDSQSSMIEDPSPETSILPIKVSFFQKFKESTVVWWIFVFFVSLAVGVSILLFVLQYSFMSSTIVNRTGEISFPGLTAPATVTRSPTGMISIQAENDIDLFMAQGYTFASERLWQLEFSYRVSSGRLSEILGSATLNVDRYIRTLNWYNIAFQTWENGYLSEFAKKRMQAFADGVNAYIDSEPQLSFEFQLLGIEPSKFSPVTMLTWSKMLSLDLSKNFKAEMSRMKLFEESDLNMIDIDKIFPEYPANAPTIFQAADWNSSWSVNEDAHVILQKSNREATRDTFSYSPKNIPPTTTTKTTKSKSMSTTLLDIFMPVDQRLEELFGPDTISLNKLFTDWRSASNNWVVDKSRTDSKNSILANDPHLSFSTDVPSIWIMVHLKCPEFESLGVAFPATPGVVLGRNNFISWGATNVGTDCQDLWIIDQLSEQNYQWNNTVTSYSIRHEIFNVSGDFDTSLLDSDHEEWDSKEKHINRTMRSTVYGPVWSDLPHDVSGLPDPEKAKTNHVVAFQWTSFDPNDTTIETFINFQYAHNFNDFHDALSKYIAPAQNFVFADTTGEIGWQLPGHIPLRPFRTTWGNSTAAELQTNHPAYLANDPYILGNGEYPTIGNGSFDWEGFIPYEYMPHVYKPQSGFIATANCKVIPYGISLYQNATILSPRDFSPPYRERRITDLITEHKTITPQIMKEIQFDSITYTFLDIQPVLDHVDIEKAKNNKWEYGDIDDETKLLYETLYNQEWTDSRIKTGKVWVERMRKWDGNTLCHSTEATLWASWYIELRRLLTPLTGNEFQWPDHGIFYRLTTIAQQGPDSGANSDSFCKLQGQDNCVEFAAVAFMRALSRLNWKPQPYCNVHAALFEHAIFGNTILGCLFNREVPVVGDRHTVNVAPFGWDFKVNHGPSYRGIYEMTGDEKVSGDIIMPMGQSGNFFNNQLFDNLNQIWDNFNGFTHFPFKETQFTWDMKPKK